MSGEIEKKVLVGFDSTQSVMRKASRIGETPGGKLAKFFAPRREQVKADRGAVLRTGAKVIRYESMNEDIQKFSESSIAFLRPQPNQPCVMMGKNTRCTDQCIKG